MSTDRIPENEPDILGYVAQKITGLSDKNTAGDSLELSKVLTLTPEIAEMLKGSKAERIHLSGVQRVIPGSIATLLKTPNLKTLNLQNLPTISDEDAELIARFLLESPSRTFYGTREGDKKVDEKKDAITQGGGISIIQLGQAIATANARRAETFEFPMATLSTFSAYKLADFTGKKIVLTKVTTISPETLSTLLNIPTLQNIFLSEVRSMDAVCLRLLADFVVNRPGTVHLHPDLQRAYLDVKLSAFQAYSANLDPADEEAALQERTRRVAEMYTKILQRKLPHTHDAETQVMRLFNISEGNFRWDDTNRFMMIRAVRQGVPGYLVFPSPLAAERHRIGVLGNFYDISPDADVQRTGIQNPVWISMSALENPSCNYDISRLDPLSPEVHKGQTFAIPGPPPTSPISTGAPIPELVMPPAMPPLLPAQPIRKRDVTVQTPFVPADETSPLELSDAEIDDVPEPAVPESNDPMQRVQAEINEASFGKTELNLILADDTLPTAVVDLLTDAKNGYHGERLILPLIVHVEPGMLARILTILHLKTLSIPKVEKLDASDLRALKHFIDGGGAVITSQAIEDAISTARASTDPGEVRIMEKATLDTYLQKFRGVTGGIEDVNFFFEGSRDDIVKSFDTLRYAIESLSPEEKKVLKNIVLRLDAKMSDLHAEYLGGKKVAFQIGALKSVDEVLADIRTCITETKGFDNAFIQHRRVKNTFAKFTIEPARYIPEDLSRYIFDIEDAVQKLSKVHTKFLGKLTLSLKGDEFTLSSYIDKTFQTETYSFLGDFEQPYKGLKAYIDSIARTEEGQKIIKGFSLPAMPKLSVSATTASIAKRVGVVVAAAAVGSVGAYEVITSQKPPAPVVVNAGKAGSKEALPNGAIVTFTNLEEALSNGYFVRTNGDYEIADGFMLVNPQVPIDTKSPATFRLKKIGIPELE